MTNENNLAALRQAVARIERRPVGLSDADQARVTFGIDAVEAALGGSMPRAAVHDIHAAQPCDSGAALGFALGLAARIGGSVLLIETAQAIRERGGLHGPGLAAFGLDPARCLFVRVPDARALLFAAAEGLACKALGVVIAVLQGETKAYDLTASRRLSLAAGQSGVTGFMLHAGAGADTPSATATRWRVATAASPVPGLRAGGVGPPVFEADLLRRRNGPPLSFRLAWSSHERSFATAPLPRDRDASPARRTGHPGATAGGSAAA